MNDIESFSALMNLSRTAKNNLNNKQWPDEAFETKWKSFIKELKSFGDEEKDLSEITDASLQLLQKRVDLFFASEKHDINIIKIGNKKNIPRIISHASKLIVNNRPFSSRDNLNNFILFLNTIPKDDYQTIAVPLMRYYLNSNKPETGLCPIIRSIFSTFEPSMSVYEKDIELYVDPDYIATKLMYAEKQFVLNDALKNIGVSEKYINTEYMKSLFFIWFFTLNQYNPEILQNNKKNIDECSSDEKKLILAAVIVSTFNQNVIPKAEKDDFIRRIDKDFFPTPSIDKTEKKYWTLLSAELALKDINKLLELAHKYYSNIFTRFIITLFFDSLSDVAKDNDGTARAEFWRGYGTSDEFIDIKIVVNSFQKKRMLSGLADNERSIISKHIINNKNESYSESPVFVIEFKTKIIVDFLEINNPIQIFNVDDFQIQNLISVRNVYSYTEFKVFGQKDRISKITNRDAEQGCIYHTSGWQDLVDDILWDNDISSGI